MLKKEVSPVSLLYQTKNSSAEDHLLGNVNLEVGQRSQD